MKFVNTVLAVTLSFTAAAAQADDSVYHSGQASKHSALSVAGGAASIATAASVAVAVPLVVVGGASLIAGSIIADSANRITSSHAHHGPLVISDTTVTADPAPDQVIIIQNNQMIERQTQDKE